MHLSFQQINPTTVKTAADLTIPAGATHAELSASVDTIMYTMDNSTTPSATVGMAMNPYHSNKIFLIEDIKRIKFIAGGAGAKLNISYFAGRDI